MESSWAKDAINVSRPSALNIPVAYTVAECQYSKAATESDLLLILYHIAKHGRPKVVG